MAKLITPEEMTAYVETTWNKCQQEAWKEPEWVATISNWGKVQWREDVFPQLGAKLYSAPPKRKWVGLTDEDKNEIYKVSKENNHTWGMFMRDIEAKLKEKNT